MEAEKKLPLSASVNDEADRIRDIFKHSFQQSDGELERLIPENFTDTISRRSDAHVEPVDDEFDWSITVANVEAVVDANKAIKAAVLAAEKRAEAAEAKAKEALHWLQLLHKAVLKGIPDRIQ